MCVQIKDESIKVVCSVVCYVVRVFQAYILKPFFLFFVCACAGSSPP